MAVAVVWDLPAVAEDQDPLVVEWHHQRVLVGRWPVSEAFACVLCRRLVLQRQRLLRLLPRRWIQIDHLRSRKNLQFSKV